MRRWVAVVALALAAAFWLCGTDPLQASGQGDPAAQRALDAVTTGTFDLQRPTAEFPAGFAAVMGYRPEVATGPHNTPILYKPDGDCSSFTGNTAYDFSIVCKEHDLAYDIVRYATRTGTPLDPAARQQADAMFDRDLHARCDQLRVTGFDWGMCHTYAEGFAQAVKLNSWRQGYRAPEQESPWRWTAMLLLFGGFLGIPLALRFLRNRRAAQPFAIAFLPPRSGRDPAGDQLRAERVTHSLQGMA